MTRPGIPRAAAAVVAVLLALVAAPAGAKGLRFGIVDMRRAVSETTDGRAAAKRLTALKKKLEAELNRKAKALKGKIARLRKRGSILAAAERRKQEAALRQEAQALRQRFAEAERDLMKRQTKALLQIQRRVARVVARLARRDGLDYIVERSAVLVAPGAADMTSEVIRTYNRTRKGK